MNTMPLVQIHGVNDVRIDRVPVPVPGPEDVLIEVVNCGICGSDLGYIGMGGVMPDGQPMPLGHELSGRVSAVGAAVTEVTPGQRVVVNPIASGTAIGNGGPEGGFAPWLLVTGAARAPDAVIPLPEPLSYEQGTMVEPLSVAMHGVNRSGVEAGQSVLVMGAGPIGLCAVVVLKYRGVEDIVVVDQSAHRLSIAAQLGATVTCDARRQDLAAVLGDQHGETNYYGLTVVGTDVYIEATGVGAVLEQAVALAKPDAGIIVIGVHKAPIQFNPMDLMMKELRMIGSMGYAKEFSAVIDMMLSGAVDFSALISHRFELGEFPAALAVAGDPQRAAKVMVSVNPQAGG